MNKSGLISLILIFLSSLFSISATAANIKQDGSAYLEQAAESFKESEIYISTYSSGADDIIGFGYIVKKNLVNTDKKTGIQSASPFYGLFNIYTETNGLTIPEEQSLTRLRAGVGRKGNIPGLFLSEKQVKAYAELSITEETSQQKFSITSMQFNYQVIAIGLLTSLSEYPLSIEYNMHSGDYSSANDGLIIKVSQNKKALSISNTESVSKISFHFGF